MKLTVLLTGFGPFPGAPINPSGPLVHMIARRRDPHWSGVRRIAHVFRTSYAAVDRELPELLAQSRPQVLIMFGLATRSRRIRIETRARNARNLVTPDADGQLPPSERIAGGAPEFLPLCAPSRHLAEAARAAGVAAATSRDAGNYLCNYLCWRAGEAARQDGGPRIVTFVHVPPVTGAGKKSPHSCKESFTMESLLNAGTEIVLAALASAHALTD
jgi:pyroglutamyl-peptidase